MGSLGEGSADGLADADASVGAAEPAGALPLVTGAVGASKRINHWLAGVAALAVLAGLGYSGWALYGQHQQDVAGIQALKVARNYVVKLTNIDSSTIDDRMGEILDGSTGEFKDMYGKSSKHLRQELADNHAAAHGTVVEATVKSATTNKVVVLMFIDQSVSNRNSPNSQLDRSRIKMTMEKVDGRWLASKVQLL